MLSSVAAQQTAAWQGAKAQDSETSFTSSPSLILEKNMMDSSERSLNNDIKVRIVKPSQDSRACEKVREFSLGQAYLKMWTILRSMLSKNP